MLDSTLTPDGATPTLLLKHWSLYKWKPTVKCVCIAKWHKWGVFIVSQGCFPDLVEAVPWRCVAGRPPRGRPAMSCGQTDVAKLVHSPPPLRNRSRQASAYLVPKWGRLAKVGSIGHPLGPLGRGLVLRGLSCQWTPVVTPVLINFPFRSLEKS
jgi:hypothetical protein